jgi:NAD(P)-dependent dehydrogenase (short-subunit alcohol dehydrogenase family)
MSSVLVTGAGRGIGLAITEHMSRRGWDVYATARSDAALSSLGRLPNVHPIELDITDRSAIAALPEQLPAESVGARGPCGASRHENVLGVSIENL